MIAENQPEFSSLGLEPEILHALKDLGFERATPIQAEAIPCVLASERDLLGFAQTGTGKTAAFSLPLIQKIERRKRYVQALILCPTRELCMQITRDINSFSKYMPKVNVVAIFGGSSMGKQIAGLESGAQIVVGTPGRVADLVKRGKLKLENLQTLVLDEADDMLDRGFKEDLDLILDGTPEEKQTLLFSATMSSWIEDVAKKRMHNAQRIEVARQNQGAETVTHQALCVHERDRYAALRRLLDVNPDVYGIVFCRTRRQTQDIAAKLITHGYPAQAIHGDIDQRDRTKVMDQFRKRQIQILVATDVAARGIDVNELTHVINYELPDSPETYVHRSGRTGRAGNEGVSIVLINMREHGKLRRIEGIMKKKFETIDVPTGDEICKAQLLSLVHRVKTAKVDTKNLEQYMPAIYEELSGMSYEELIQHFVSVEFNRFLQHYSNMEDISTQRAGRRDRFSRDDRRGGRRDGRRDGRSSRERARDVKLKEFAINFGKQDGFNPKVLFGLVNKNKSLKGLEIGNIKINKDHTIFEADASKDRKVVKFLQTGSWNGRDVKVLSL